MRMRQQKLDKGRDQITVQLPKNVGFKVRHLAGNRGTSISNVASGLIQESLKRKGFLKEDDG